MNVRFMIAVGSRPKYGCIPMASTIAQILAEVLCDRNIREAKGTAICQDECPQVDRVSLAMLADFRPNDPVAFAAFEIVLDLDRLES